MTDKLEDRFARGLHPRWVVTEIGQGVVRPTPGALWLTMQPTQRGYSNAQIADYDYQQFNLTWKPPLRMTVTAWATCPGDSLRGTAGFGFWNHPFSPDAGRLPRLPRVIWFFFASPPSNMQLDYSVPGHGWKASTLDATQRDAWALTPLAVPAGLLMRFPALYAKLWPPIQRRLRISERLLDNALLAERHTYTLDWLPERARFAVDGETVLEAPFAPRGAMGFVAWLDTRWAVVTPQGKLRFGVVRVEQKQSLVLEQVVIEEL